MRASRRESRFLPRVLLSALRGIMRSPSLRERHDSAAGDGQDTERRDYAQSSMLKSSPRARRPPQVGSRPTHAVPRFGRRHLAFQVVRDARVAPFLSFPKFPAN